MFYPLAEIEDKLIFVDLESASKKVYAWDSETDDFVDTTKVVMETSDDSFMNYGFFKSSTRWSSLSCAGWSSLVLIIIEGSSLSR